MNFVDAYDITGSSTPSAEGQPETSLNEEVAQVVGQLSRFWGGFRKQSQSVLETARKDLGGVVQQAQKELTRLTADSSASTSSTEPKAEGSADASAAEPSTSAPASDAPATQPQAQPTLLSRLQSTLPPHLLTAVQTKLPDALAHARAASLSAPDLVTLRSTLAAELARVQESSGELLSRVQGSSEDLLREASDLLKDAVRVVPPEEARTPVVLPAWDGTDVWMVSGPAREEREGKGKEREASVASRRSTDSARAATRAEALLAQLRHDPTVIRADPVLDAYTAWLEQTGEIEPARIEKEIEAHPELVKLRDTLVPDELDATTFWSRYYFRAHQVEQDEARRKALLQGSTETEEEFSWEDDDEPSSPNRPATSTSTFAASSVPTSTPSAPPYADPGTATQPAPASAVPAHLAPAAAAAVAEASPRQSSEESFDVVSAQLSRVGSDAGVSAAPSESEVPSEVDVRDASEGGEGKEGDEDSDWE